MHLPACLLNRLRSWCCMSLAGTYIKQPRAQTLKARRPQQPAQFDQCSAQVMLCLSLVSRGEKVTLRIPPVAAAAAHLIPWIDDVCPATQTHKAAGCAQHEIAFVCLWCRSGRWMRSRCARTANLAAATRPSCTQCSPIPLGCEQMLTVCQQTLKGRCMQLWLYKHHPAVPNCSPAPPRYP